MVRNRILNIPWVTMAALLFWLPNGVIAAGPKVVQVQTAWSQGSEVKPGAQVALAIVFDIKEHFHIYPTVWKEKTNFNPTLTAVTVGQLPKGLRVGELQAPPPVRVPVKYTDPPSTIEAYEGHVVLYLPLVVEENAPPGHVDFKLAVTYGACNETSCLMPVLNMEVPVALDIVQAPASSVPGNAELFKGFDITAFARMSQTHAVVSFDFFGGSLKVDPSSGLGLAALLALAAVGGMLLNFTPCVLPVIPIKIMGLSRAAGNRGRCLLLGVMVSLGIVLFWLGLGVAIGTIYGFTATNQLFQHPTFVIAVGLVIAVMAVGMGGFFTIRLPQAVYNLNPDHGSIGGSLGFGVMTAVLSTPCTAPFMGGAAAWAVTQRPAVTLIAFGTIGAGMALPYLLLSAFPALVARMPRTGPGSELIKQVMGILMLGAAAYFIGAGISGAMVQPSEPPSRAYWWVVFFFVAAAGVWMAYRTFRITPSIGKRAVFGIIGLLALTGSTYGAVRVTDQGPIDWVYYTPERFAAAQHDGKVVVMDFTAEWCLNCKVIEANVLHSAAVVEALKLPGVVPMKVDLTGNNAAGNAKLQEVGRVMIPALVVFSPDGSQTLNSDAYTPQQVVDAVHAAQH